MVYKKTFPKETTITSLDAKLRYYLEKPFDLTAQEVKDFIVQKYRLHPHEARVIQFTISPPSREKSAHLFMNYDMNRLFRILMWLDSNELRYRPGGRGYEETMKNFQHYTNTLEKRDRA